MYCTYLHLISTERNLPGVLCHISPVVRWCAVSSVLKPVCTCPARYFNEENRILAISVTILWEYGHALTQIKSDRFRPLIWLASLQVASGKPNIQNHVQRVTHTLASEALLLACGPTLAHRHHPYGLLLRWEAHLLNGVSYAKYWNTVWSD